MNSTSSQTTWPADPFQPSNPSVQNTRPDRPRLIAPTYKWQALPTLIQNDPYLKGWNDTIFGNATSYYSLVPVVYFLDGDSGILDNARDVKMRIKAFAYVYRMTNDTKWVDRAWAELQVSCIHFMHVTSLLIFLIRMPPATEQYPLDPL